MKSWLKWGLIGFLVILAILPFIGSRGLLILAIFSGYIIFPPILMVILMVIVIFIIIGILIRKTQHQNRYLIISFIILCIFLLSNSFLWYRMWDSEFYSTNNPVTGKIMKNYDLKCRNDKIIYESASASFERMNNCRRERLPQNYYKFEDGRWQIPSNIAPDSPEIQEITKVFDYCTDIENKNINTPFSISSCVKKEYDKRSDFDKMSDKVKEIIFVIVFYSWQPLIPPG